MLSLISVLYLVLFAAPSLCRPQETLETELKVISTTLPYEYDDYGGEEVTEKTEKADYVTYDYYGTYDDYGHYGDYFTYGDRNNPADTALAVDEKGAKGGKGGHEPYPCEMPWVFVIVPMLHVDLIYVGDDHLEDMDVKPVDTYFFEFGEFGMGHFDMGGLFLDYESSEEYPTTPQADYPQYDVMADHYESAGDLDNANVMDYPGIDHGSYWVDWIFMRPPDQIIR